MELKQYASLLWRWAWLIALGTVLAAVSAYVTSKLTTPVYSASATLLINQAPNDKATDYTSILTSERLARTYSELLKQRPVLEETISSLGLDLTTETLGRQVEVQLVRDTQLIKLTVEDTDPARAALLANTIPQVFSQQNQELQASRYAASKNSLSQQLDDINRQISQTQGAIDDIGSPKTAAEETELNRLQANLAQYRQSYTGLLQSYENVRLAEASATSNISVVEPATVPERPVRPRTLMNTALAGVVGLMLAVGVIFLIEYLDDSIRSPDQVREVLGLPVIGVIGIMESMAGRLGAPVAASDPRSPVAEAFRALRTSIHYAGVDRPVRSVLVTSAGPGDGKTTMAANLAVVMAQAGLRVILLDADLRRPATHKILNRPNRNGLTDLMIESAIGRDGVVQETAVRNLSLITSGPIPPNPSELLSSQKMGQVLEWLATVSDVVIIDSPPMLAVTDATVLARKVDGVLLVVDSGATRIQAAAQAAARLEQVGARALGVVINKLSARRSAYYYQYYQYYHYYHYQPLDGGRSNGRGLLGNGSRWPWRGRRNSAPEPELPPARSSGAEGGR